MADGIFDQAKTIVGTDVKVSFNIGASRFEVDDPAGTGTFKLTPGDERVSRFKALAAAAATLASVTGAGAFSLAMIDANGDSFGSIEYQPASVRFKLVTGSTEFAYVPSSSLGDVGVSIDQINADRLDEGV